jgi:hypothetical protein
MPPRAATQYQAETEVVRRIANDPGCRWRWTDHVQMRMVERGITAADILRAVKSGAVDQIRNDGSWRVEGMDVDDKRIQVAVAVYEAEVRITIITAY